MGWFDDDSKQANAARQVQEYGNEASLSHELIAGAAAYEAAKAYEKHCDEQGHPGSYQEAKEILAGITGGCVDRIIETRGMDEYDIRKAKDKAQRQTEVALDWNQRPEWDI